MEKAEVKTQGVANSTQNTDYQHRETDILNKNKLLFKLKSEGLIDRLIIKLFLEKYQRSIEEIAFLIQVDVEVLEQALKGVHILPEEKSHLLISYFYLTRI